MMRLLDLTLPTPAENLALDEALLLCGGPESLRLWEARSPFVVLGRSSRHAEETNAAECRDASAPVLRRVSGGASIVTGPGCLMYAVTLDLRKRPALADLGAAHAFVLERIARAARHHESTAAIAGTSDLACQRPDGLRKFSGNSLRRVRDRLLYHGTLLYGFDLSLVTRLLSHAPRQPGYRADRTHGEFLTNLRAGRDALAASLAERWDAHAGTLSIEEEGRTRDLVAEKYSLASWNQSQ